MMVQIVETGLVQAGKFLEVNRYAVTLNECFAAGICNHGIDSMASTVYVIEGDGEGGAVGNSFCAIDISRDAVFICRV